MSVGQLEVTPLRADTFHAFGDVIDTRGDAQLINRGTSQLFADLARVDVHADRGRPRVSLFRATPARLPLAITMLERHPLSSQLFMPLGPARFLIVVAPGADEPEPGRIRAFLTDGLQGLNYSRGTWHHPLIALNAETDFLVIDRLGPGSDCDEHHFDEATQLVVGC
jgi:ureidoglycolate lyase